MPATTVRKPAEASSGKTFGRTHSTHSEESRQDRRSLIWQDGQDVRVSLALSRTAQQRWAGIFYEACPVRPPPSPRG